MSRSQAAPLGDLQDRRDREGIARIAAGDESGFVELYRRYSAAAYGLARRVTADAVLGEEVVQEVFTSIWRRAGSFDSTRGTVRSWLLAQVHHKSVDIVRRESAERRRTTQNIDLVPVDDPIGDVVEEAWMATRRVEVRTALATLPEDQRRVLELSYLGGMTQTQVAAEMKIPLGTVKSRTVGAMRRLRTALGGTFEGGTSESEPVDEPVSRGRKQ